MPFLLPHREHVAPTDFTLSVPLDYIETTIPAGMTIGEYRRGRSRRATHWERLKHLAGGARVTASTGRQMIP